MIAFIRVLLHENEDPISYANVNDYFINDEILYGPIRLKSVGRSFCNHVSYKVGVKNFCHHRNSSSGCTCLYLVAERLGGDDGNLLDDPLVGVEVEGELRVILLDDDSSSLLDGLGSDTAHLYLLWKRSRVNW